jgi:hypothetical protein
VLLAGSAQQLQEGVCFRGLESGIERDGVLVVLLNGVSWCFV